MPGAAGKFLSNSRKASSPPAEPPMPTTQKGGALTRPVLFGFFLFKETTAGVEVQRLLEEMLI